MSPPITYHCITYGKGGPVTIEAPTSSLLTSTDDVAQLVNRLTKLPVSSTQPSLYVDCRRKEPGDDRDISILALLVYPQNHVYLVDIDALGQTAFTVKGLDGETLGAILQSATVPKVFNAVAFSSNPLYARFGIFLQGVQDIQILQWASHPGPLNYPIVNQRLGAAIEWDARILSEEKLRAKICYEAAARLFKAEKGGSLQVFGKRPLAQEIWAYCVHILKYLPHLHNIYWNQVVKLQREPLVAELTQRRVQCCRKPVELDFVSRPPVSSISSQGSQIDPTSRVQYRPRQPIHRKFQARTFRKVVLRR